jgi:hypothetical protein
MHLEEVADATDQSDAPSHEESGEVDSELEGFLLGLCEVAF